MGSAVEVVLKTGLEDRSMFYETIRILNEERAEIINVSYSLLDDTILYSLHAEVYILTIFLILPSILLFPSKTKIVYSFNVYHYNPN